ncbi:MAG: hypothetical protein IPP34_18565 [Bacteroidetes bacterium]|nr:hypothetical protein [Bacteroidota bacterium]
MFITTICGRTTKAKGIQASGVNGTSFYQNKTAMIAETLMIFLTTAMSGESADEFHKSSSTEVKHQTEVKHVKH